ncbi:MAG: hypothetical protein ACYDBJ_04640 [Aggregatilineales bacterium]
MTDQANSSGVETETLAETENYMLWRSKEPDGEVSYHVDLDTVTLHFYEEEWHEFVDLIRAGGSDASKPAVPPKKRR